MTSTETARRWTRRLTAAVVACAVSAAAPTAGARAADPESRPFPVDRTTILRDDTAVFHVEGRRRIPKNVEITVLKGVQILGRGEGATLEVEGRLKIHGVEGKPVVLADVVIEPQPVFQEIKVSQIDLKGRAGITNPADKPCAGYFMIELVTFPAAPGLDLTMSGGTLEMATVSSRVPVSVKAVDTPGTTKGNAVKVEIRGCAQDAQFARTGLQGGLTIESADEVIVRLSRLGGMVKIHDWRKSLIFDGNKVDAYELALTQPVAGRFRLAQLFKCDVYSEKVRFSAPPAKPGETEDVTFERFHFARAAGTDRASVMKVVEDGTANPAENGVRAKVGKLNDRPLELGGPKPE